MQNSSYLTNLQIIQTDQEEKAYPKGLSKKN